MSDAGRVLHPLKTSPLSGSQFSSCKRKDMLPGLLGTFRPLTLWDSDSSQLCTPYSCASTVRVRTSLRAMRCVSLPGTGDALREPGGWN